MRAPWSMNVFGLTGGLNHRGTFSSHLSFSGVLGSLFPRYDAPVYWYYIGSFIGTACEQAAGFLRRSNSFHVTECHCLLLDCGQGKVAADTSDCYLDFHKLTLHLQGDKEWEGAGPRLDDDVTLTEGRDTGVSLSSNQTELPQTALHGLHHLHRQSGHQGSGESAGPGGASERCPLPWWRHGALWLSPCRSVRRSTRRQTSWRISFKTLQVCEGQRSFSAVCTRCHKLRFHDSFSLNKSDLQVFPA